MTKNPTPCRNSLIVHPPESSMTLDLMSEAADLMIAGRIEAARERMLTADIRSLRKWFHYEAQPTTKVLRRHGITRSDLPKPPKEIRTPGRVKDRTKYAVFQRDSWHCRFCSMRVIDPRARSHFSRTFDDFHWGRPNLHKHSCIAVLASPDHVVPQQWGGSNEEDNLVTACRPCQFSRHEHRIEHCGIFDPRDRPPIKSDWDGLYRVLGCA